MPEIFNRCKQPQKLLILSCFLVISGLFLASCIPPQGIATFADGAAKALEGGNALFSDIHGSCLRRHVVLPTHALFFAPGSQLTESPVEPPELPQCASLAAQSDALTKASNVLSSYFRAMQQLALFNNATAVDAGTQTGAGIALASGLNTIQVDSVSKLATLLTETVTERYQQHNLARILSEADPSVASITQAFEQIAEKDYLSLLREEQQTVAAQYREVSDTKNPATLLLLNRAYGQDLDGMNTRKKAASAYVESLQQIREGHHMLAKQAGGRNTKQLTAELRAYTTKLSGLLPTLSKGL